MIFFWPQISSGQEVDLPLNDATDNNLTWTTSSFNAWTGQTQFSYDGSDAAMAIITNSYYYNSSWIQTTVTGPARVSFWWLYDSLEAVGYYSFDLRVDGSSVLTPNQHSVWVSNYVDVPFGTHTLEWYGYSYPYANGQVLFALDQVTVTPITGDLPQVTVTPNSTTLEVGQTVTIHATVSGTAPVTNSWTHQFSNTDYPYPYGSTNTDIVLNPVTRANSGIYTITVKNFFGSAQATSVVTASLDGIPEALDTTNLQWSANGADWFKQTAFTHDGVDALQSPSARYADGSVATQVTGPASVKYWVKYSASSGDSYERFATYIDYDEVHTDARDDGGFDWRQEEILVPAGTHSVSWDFRMGYYLGDAVWLDEVTVEPLTGDAPTIVSQTSDTTINQGDQIDLSVDATGSLTLAYQWYQADWPIDGETNNTLHLSLTVSPDIDYWVKVSNLFGETTSAPIYVTVTPSPISLKTALDNPDLVWQTNPNPFFGQTHESHDHVSAAQGNPDCYVQTTIVGPGLLTFWWKSSSGFTLTDVTANTDVLDYDGTNDWREASIAFTAGPHVLQWYSSDSVSYLDSVQFTSKNYGPPQIVVQPKDQHVDLDGTATFFVKANVAPPYSYQWTFDGSDIWDETNSSLTISNVTSDSFGYYNVRITDPFGTTNSSYVILGQKTDYGKTLGEPGLGWDDEDDGFDPTWFAQSRVKHGNSPALQSLPTPDGGASTLYNSIVGPGTLSFWWKVSSETNYDFLQFTVDDQLEASISGNTGWKHFRFHIANTISTVNWSYVKDSDSAQGMDCGWVSGVTFTPDPINLVSIVPHDLTVYDGSAARFESVSYGSPPYEFEWVNPWGNDVSDGPELKLVPATMDSAGTYSLLVYGDSGSGSDTTVLHVLPALDPIRTISGSEIDLKLHTTGDKPTSYTWSDNGNQLYDDGRIVGSTNAVLKIKATLPSDGGWYGVTAVNDHTGYTWQPQAPVSVLPAGPIVGWGTEDSSGFNDVTVPSDLRDATGISTGWVNSMAILPDTTVRAWGNLGGYDLYVPDDLTNVTMIGMGGDFAAALMKGGLLSVWSYSDAFDEMYFNGVRSFSAGPNHLLVAQQDGTVATWGETDDNGELDAPSDLKGVTAVAAGNGFSLALTRAGKIVGWGNNDFGQLMPPHVGDIMAIAAGDGHGLALRRNGTVVAWGDNSSGQTDVPAGLSKVVAIAAGAVHSVALTADGRVVSWGATDRINPFTGLSDGLAPVGVTNVARITAAGSHTVALFYAPTIVQQPLIDYEGGATSVIFVDAGGRAPLFYDWRVNGHFIKTTKEPSLVVRTPTSAAGQNQKYDVVVRNRYGSTTSQTVSFADFGYLSFGWSHDTEITQTSVGTVASTLVGATNIALIPPPMPSATLGDERLDISVRGNSVVVSWPGGSSFVLEAADSLEGPFSNSGLATPVSAGGTNSLTIPVSAQQQFYRLRGTSN